MFYRPNNLHGAVYFRCSLCVVVGFNSTMNNRHWNAVIHLMNGTDPKTPHLRPIKLLDSSWTTNRSYICQYHCKLFSYCQVLTHRVEWSSCRILDL